MLTKYLDYVLDLYTHVLHQASPNTFEKKSKYLLKFAKYMIYSRYNNIPNMCTFHLENLKKILEKCSVSHLCAHNS